MPRQRSTRPGNDAEQAAGVSPSREGVNFPVGEVAGHEGDGNGIIARGAADSGDKRAGAFGTGAGAEDENENVFVLVDQFQDFLGLCALSQGLFGGDAVYAFDTGRIFGELGARFFVGFGAHDIGDAEPLLALVKGFHYAQHNHIAADARGAAAGKIHRAIAFLGVVDDDQKLRCMPGFVAAALARHRVVRFSHSHPVSAGYRANVRIKRTTRKNIKSWWSFGFDICFRNSRPDWQRMSNPLHKLSPGSSNTTPRNVMLPRPAVARQAERKPAVRFRHPR